MNSFARSLAVFALPLASMLAVAGCAADAGDADGDGATSQDEIKKGSAEQWVYGGTLPHLDEPAITVSLTAHTARVTGLLPDGFEGELPYYADQVQESGRTRIAVVYPIATGISVNSQRTDYEINRVVPWVPTNEKATWGGFPFIPYNGGIAFHGPITAEDGQWKLIRGAVSHGCNRMMGEHVTELAHLIGVDMTTKVHRADSLTGFDVPVSVLRKTDTWQGREVDVDYDAQPGVKRPRGPNVQMFKSWSADQLGTFVCALNKSEASNGVIPAGYCSRKGRNSINPVTGR